MVRFPCGETFSAGGAPLAPANCATIASAPKNKKSAKPRITNDRLCKTLPTVFMTVYSTSQIANGAENSLGAVKLIWF